MSGALAAEWTKFRTVRGWVFGLVLAAVMIVVFTFLQAAGKQSGYCTSPNQNSCVTGHLAVPTGPDGEAVTDTYEFAHRTLSGDGTVTARVRALAGVVSAEPADVAPSLAHVRDGLVGWAKAGVLITPSTRAGAQYAAVVATPGHGVRFQSDYTHDRAGLAGTVGVADPRWVRLSRHGDTLTGADSTDGRTWHTIASVRLAHLPEVVDVGLFTTSPNTAAGLATRLTARFDHVAVTPLDAGAASRVGAWIATDVGAGARTAYPTLGSGSFRRRGDAVTLAGSGDIAPAVATVGGDTVSDDLLFGIDVAVLVLSVVGTLFVTSEYRRGLMLTTLAATPARSRVLLAKAAVIGGAGFMVGAVAAAVAVPLGEHVLTAHGNYIFPAGPLGLARVIVGCGALVGLSSVSVLGVAAVVRTSGWTLLLSFLLFILPTFVGPGVLGGPSSGGAAAQWLYRVTPAAAFSLLGILPRSGLVDYPYTMSNGYYPISPLLGLAVLIIYAAAAVAAAAFVLNRRDA